MRKDSAIKDWFTLINPRPTTEINYLRGMKIYTDFVGKSPEELIREAEEEEENGVIKKRRKIKRYLFNYIDFLNNSNVSPNTVKTRLSIVKSFYNLLDIELPSLPKSRNGTPNLENNLAIPTKDDLIETLNACESKLEKAIILVGISSGLSSNEIRNLKVKDFKEGYDPQTEITTLKLRRKKTNVDFITFLSPEASRAVWAYLEYRGRVLNGDHKKRKEQLEKQRIVSDDGYLFVLKRISPKYLETKDEELRSLNRNTYMEIYRSVALRAHKNTGKGDWNLIRSHNLRKFFNSALLNAGADSFFVEYCMGHKIDDTKATYFRADPKMLRDIYARYIPYLTIQKEFDLSVSPDFKRIAEENEKLRAEVERAIVERSELKAVKAELEELKLEQEGIRRHFSIKDFAKEIVEASRNRKE